MDHDRAIMLVVSRILDSDDVTHELLAAQEPRVHGASVSIRQLVFGRRVAIMPDHTAALNDRGNVRVLRLGGIYGQLGGNIIAVADALLRLLRLVNLDGSSPRATLQMAQIQVLFIVLVDVGC